MELFPIPYSFVRTGPLACLSPFTVKLLDNESYYGMDVPTLSSFLRPIITVLFSETGETGDIYP